MKRVILFLSILLIAFTSGLNSPSRSYSQELLPQPIQIEPITPPKNGSCIVAGCSSQLCVDSNTGPIFTTCEWRDEYACYKGAECKLQDNDQCGWIMTDDLKTCLEGNPKPTQPPTNHPVCGNHICEAGEADESFCPTCETDPCPLMPCWFRSGTCPSDCTNTIPPIEPPLPTPTCRPKPKCLDTAFPCEIMEPENGWCPEPLPTLPPICSQDKSCPDGQLLNQACKCEPNSLSRDASDEADSNNSENQNNGEGKNQSQNQEGKESENQGNNEQQSYSQYLEKKTPNINLIKNSLENLLLAKYPQDTFMKRIKNLPRRLSIYYYWFFSQ